ncbi:MAG: response regulator transcription factor [Candidatus Woesebacteria bacterium]
MKILVIEDEHKIADSIKRGLEQERFTVDVSYDGVSGYDMAASNSYDSIVLDLMLPGMDGMTICKNLREEKVDTPILMLTAKGELDDKIEGFRLGTDDYLVKPFAFAELVARLRALTKRNKDGIATILQVADLSVDTTGFTIKRASKSITLSRKEFDLLVFLMRHPGKTLTKDQIIDGVWEYDSNVLPNTIEVYIGYLRNKIDKAFPDEPSLIQTVRGFGYKIG